MAEYGKHDVVLENLVNGSNLFLYIFDNEFAGDTTAVTGGNVLAFSTSLELSTEAESIDAANKMSCRWNSVIPGNNSYTINSSALYTQGDGYSYDSLMDKMIAGENVGWAIGVTDDTKNCKGDGSFAMTQCMYFGNAAISSLSLTAGNNEIAQYSITLTGSGAIQSAS